jgi:hypothetical protein
MQKSQSDRTVAIILLILMVVFLFIVVLIQMLQSMGRKAAKRQEQHNSLELLKDQRWRYEMEVGRLHVSNQVLENCLSTLKHETMYYPGRIRSLLDEGDVAALSEVTDYYREIFGILSEQAASQANGFKLSLRRLEHGILGDENLIGYLFEILKKQAALPSLDIRYSEKSGDYIGCEVRLPGVTPTDFTPTVENIPYLLCRQIVREHGEATGRHGCGMRATAIDGGTLMTITLPRYNYAKL